VRAATLLLFLACCAQDPGRLALELSGGTCASSSGFAGPIVLDTAAPLAGVPAFLVTNEWRHSHVDLDRIQLSAEARSIGFRSDVPAVNLFAFLPSDVSIVLGDLDLSPAATASVAFQPALASVASGFDALLAVARDADACCRATAGCDGLTGTSTACTAFVRAVSRIDPNHTQYPAFQAGLMSAALTAFASYAEFDGNYWLENVELANGGTPRPAGDEAQIRLKGEARGLLGDEVVQSDGFAWELDLCRNCGAYDAATNARLPHPPSCTLYVY
jgi:hypothetical protein